MQIPCGYDLQSYQAPKIDIKGFVRDPHRTPTQLDGDAVSTLDDFIILKPVARLFRCRLSDILGSRGPTGFNPAGQTHAQHAYWPEFHDSRKLVTATRAGTLTFRVHRLCRHSALNLNRKQHRVRPNGAEAAGVTLANCCTAPQTIACSSPSNQVLEQNFYPWCPRALEVKLL